MKSLPKKMSKGISGNNVLFEYLSKIKMCRIIIITYISIDTEYFLLGDE
jgi:hypothetical protein